MLSEYGIRQALRDAERRLAAWQEPDGALVPTECYPHVRERVRDLLRERIRTLRWVLAGRGKKRKGRAA